jgi:glycine hydroxymethyltransferase
VLPDRRDRGVPRVPDAGARERRRARRHAARGRARPAHGGTDTHLLQIDLRKSDWTGKDAEERLHDVKLTVNRNTVPFDERPPTVGSGVRVGTPAATMRGFDEDDFREVGAVMVDALGGSPDLDALRARVDVLCDRRPLYPGFRGFTTYVA